MKKIKLTTNRGKVFDFILNSWLNFVLWADGTFDDEEKATKTVAEELKRLKLV